VPDADEAKESLPGLARANRSAPPVGLKPSATTSMLGRDQHTDRREVLAASNGSWRRAFGRWRARNVINPIVSHRVPTWRSRAPTFARATAVVDDDCCRQLRQLCSDADSTSAAAGREAVDYLTASRQSVSAGRCPNDYGAQRPTGGPAPAAGRTNFFMSDVP